MAKKKRSAALFEVMVKHESRRLPSRPGVFRTLYLWFKNRPRETAMASVVAREAEARQVDPPLVEAPVTGGMPPPVVREVEYVPPPPPIVESSSESPGMTVKREQGSVFLRMSYGTAIIATFALATVVVTAFLIGKRLAARPQTVLAPTTSDKIRQQPPRPNLTQVGTPARPPRTPAIVNNPEQIEGPGNAGGGVAGNAPARTTERRLGLNYVMVQAYPEEKHAIAAATLLQQNGIECTVEKGVPGFLRYSVVGMIGFSRISNNPQLDAYMSKIRSVGDLYTKNRNSFIYSFKPQPFKWQGTRRE